MITIIFSLLSVLAIAAGGIISAFSARKPAWATSWVSAYLVLVAGLIQLGLVTIWHRLDQPAATTVLLALLAYNAGNGSVIAGTLLKRQLRHYPVLVNIGGGCIALAMILLLVAVRKSAVSALLIAFIVLVAVILISMPIGLVLSNRRR